MQNLRALVVHRSPELTMELVEELRRLGTPADGASSADEALDMIGHARYGVMLLDDDLPEAGSVRVFDFLSARSPSTAVMLSIPPGAMNELPEEHENRLEFVVEPGTQAEVERLALRMRARLLRAGLADDFAGAPVPQPVHPREDNASDRGLVILLVAVAIVVVVLFLLLRSLSQPSTGYIPLAPRVALLIQTGASPA